MTVKNSVITVGSDPEFFLVDSTSKKIIPSCGLVGGNKGDPVRLTCGGFLEDNVTVEFNPDHGHRHTTMLDNLGRTTKQFQEKTGYLLSSKSEYLFSDEDLASDKAREFGCDPDWDAYNMAPRERIDPAVVGNWRFCGGHIHIGVDPWPDIPHSIFVQFLDLFSYSQWIQYDPQPQRRKYYGLPGLYRPKNYGVEYRTPSNFWATFDGQKRGYRMFVQQLMHTVQRLVYAVHNDKNALTRLYRSIDWRDVRQTLSRGEQVFNYDDQLQEFNRIPMAELGRDAEAEPRQIDFNDLAQNVLNNAARVRPGYQFVDANGRVVVVPANVNEDGAAPFIEDAPLPHDNDVPEQFLNDREWFRRRDAYRLAEERMNEAQRAARTYLTHFREGEPGFNVEGLRALNDEHERLRAHWTAAMDSWADYEAEHMLDLDEGYDAEEDVV